jgi:putative ABC transport system permease protein
MLGIIIGVAAVITMVAVGAGAQAQVDEQLRSLGTNLLAINPTAITVRGARMGAGSRYTLTEDDTLAIQREIGAVRAAAPVIGDTGQVVFGSMNWYTRYYGSTPEFIDAMNWPIAAGRNFDDRELVTAAKVVLLGETVARNLFGEHDPIGEIVRIRRVPVRVIGVLARKGQSHSGQDRDDALVLPISTIRNRVIGGSQAKLRLVHYAWAKLHDGADMEEGKAEIRALLRQRHGLQAGRDDDFTLRDVSEVTGAREESTRVMTLLLAAVASISLLVGGIGIMNIMLVSVTERSREIGLRMAVGARGRDIMSQFLMEAVALAVAGGLCGIMVGIGGSYVIAHFAGWRTHLSMYAVALALGCAAAIGVFSGVYPARKASRLMPVDALRYE